ncbi:helix-turn-helix domain-containing protein, partial [Campylobacter fetus]|uniref:helix-turn-helix domain-containing protein n=1 Tax=Campylobacter fetus TaxID=196 RepID=UPI00112FCF3A
MKLYNKIKEYRLEKGWTQGDLAKFSGVSLGSIKRYETDNGNITYANLEKIANALNIDLSYFLSPNLSPNNKFVSQYVVNNDKKLSSICRQSPNLSPN